MPTTVVTGFSPGGYNLYGKQFIETFHQFAPPGYDLMVYSAKKIPMPRGRYVLHEQLNGAHEFVEKYGDKPEYHGKKAVPGWRPKDEKAGYSYRHDAIRFCWQLFYMDHAANWLPDGDLMAWFDGDVVFKEQIPTSFIETTLAGGCDLAYLGRTSHTELGYWAVRLNSMTREFISAIGRLYRSGQVFRLEEWHSAYVFDTARQIFYIGKENNMTPGCKGNVWDKTPLAEFSTHLKGNLKNG
jgi:hypothetical protein